MFSCIFSFIETLTLWHLWDSDLDTECFITLSHRPRLRFQCNKTGLEFISITLGLALDFHSETSLLLTKLLHCVSLHWHHNIVILKITWNVTDLCQVYFFISYSTLFNFASLSYFNMPYNPTNIKYLMEYLLIKYIWQQLLQKSNLCIN